LFVLARKKSKLKYYETQAKSIEGFAMNDGLLKKAGGGNYFKEFLDCISFWKLLSGSARTELLKPPR